jgi:hypothetical protein
MLGTKLYKGKYTNKEYADLAIWCNANNATIEDKGEYYEVVEIPAPSLEELKKAKLQEVDSFIASKITGGFVSTCYNGKNILYDTDTDTQLTMSIAKNCSEGERFAEELPDGLEVRGYEQVDVDEDGTLVFSKDKTIYYFSPEQIKTWNEDFALFLRECKKEGWMKQAMVKACTTKEELAKVVLDY